MTEEPLERWAARRQGRLRKPGERKAITLGAGPQRAAHVDPDAPRMILEWDGFAWQPLMAVENYAAACLALSPMPESTSGDQAEATGPRHGTQSPGARYWTPSQAQVLSVRADRLMTIPAEVLALIEAQTGRVLTYETVSGGLNSAIAARRTAERGRAHCSPDASRPSTARPSQRSTEAMGLHGR